MRTQRETDLEDEIERLTATREECERQFQEKLADNIRLQARVDELERLYREELMESYYTLGGTRQARYSGPEEYADAIIRSEALEGEVK